MLIGVLIFAILDQINSKPYLYFLIAILSMFVLSTTIRTVILTRYFSKTKIHLTYLNESKYSARGRFWTVDQCWTGFLICSHTPI